MDETTSTILKVAYAEGVKRALLEHGVDNATATAQSEAFTDEKLAGIKEVASAVGRAAKAVGGKAKDIGQAVGRTAKNVAFDAKELPGSIRQYVKTNPNAKRNMALAGGASAAGGGAIGGAAYALLNRKKKNEEK